LPGFILFPLRWGKRLGVFKNHITMSHTRNPDKPGQNGFFASSLSLIAHRLPVTLFIFIRYNAL
jgi:hypothetical protein